jgi:hypothetical protein
MTRNLIIVAGLATLAVIAVGSLASARMAGRQLASSRIAMNGPIDATRTDATSGLATRDRSRAYWSSAANTNARDVFQPMRLCMTY